MAEREPLMQLKLVEPAEPAAKQTIKRQQLDDLNDTNVKAERAHFLPLLRRCEL